MSFANIGRSGVRCLTLLFYFKEILGSKIETELKHKRKVFLGGLDLANLLHPKNLDGMNNFGVGKGFVHKRKRGFKIHLSSGI